MLKPLTSAKLKEKKEEKKSAKTTKKVIKTETESCHDVYFNVHFFRVLVTQWETALLPWDLLCSPGRIAWEGDKHGQKVTDRLSDY